MRDERQAVERVRRILIGRDAVEKRMIDGLAFMVNGRMCCGVTGDALVVRVGPAGKDWALAQSRVRPMQFAGRSLAGFVCVDPAGYATDAALAEWIERGIAFLSSLPARTCATRRSQRS